VIDEFHPEVAVFEDLFYAANVKSALTLGHARGVCMHAAAVHDLTVYEYTPAQVKSAVTGYGRAEKPQVQQMVRALLRMPRVDGQSHPYDASDALAVALCHVHTHRFMKATAGGK
jgi:crossover junction endodeoxyribonuclease RuvC